MDNIRFTLAALILAGGPAAGWDRREHQYLGEQAFLRACESAAADTVLDRRIKDRFCGDVSAESRLYGEATWISGDHIDDNKALSGDKREALRVLESTFHYAKLANENDAHFHPGVKQEWLKRFTEAQATAARYAEAKNAGEKLQILNLVFYQNAYADHFLQDAFSTGHFGFNRLMSSSSPSRLAHDTWNRRGRYIRNREKTWYGFGDECLDPAHKRCAEDDSLQSAHMTYIIETNAWSILAALYQLSGRQAEAESAGFKAMDLLPTHFHVNEKHGKNFIPREDLRAALADRDSSRGSWLPAEGTSDIQRPGFAPQAYLTGIPDGNYFDLGLLLYFRTWRSLYLGGGWALVAHRPGPDRDLGFNGVLQGSILLMPPMKLLSTTCGLSANAQASYNPEATRNHALSWASLHAFFNLEIGKVNPMLGFFAGRTLYGEPDFRFGGRIGVTVNWLQFSLAPSKTGQGMSIELVPD